MREERPRRAIGGGRVLDLPARKWGGDVGASD